MPTNSEFRKRTIEFLNLFRSTSNMYFKVETHNDLPTASGFASSASGFAALVIALDDLFNWNLASEHLSILARLGSGSASRSIYPGFVYWEAGIKSDGTDSYAKALSIKRWDNLRVGLLVINEEKKDTSSRDAMKMAVNTSPYYSTWIKKVNKDLEQIKSAIISHDIQKTGEIAEHNALSMHATTITSCPPLLYWTSQTVSMIEKVWMLRQKYNKNVYFTIDAGPNLILLFEKNDEEIVKKTFPKIRIITPLFGSISNNGN
jgi:diphosphomevalonate decarboxylase